MPSLPSITMSPHAPAPKELERSVLRDTAERLEAHFLAEMLKAAGLHEQRGTLSGGTGEDQFASFLRQAQAERMAEAGGIGLAEAFFQTLVQREEA